LQLLALHDGGLVATERAVGRARRSDDGWTGAQDCRAFCRRAVTELSFPDASMFVLLQIYPLEAADG